jgi:hypothetical protein
MLLPLSAGGDQVEPWQYLRAIEEICRHDGPVGWNLFVANSAALIAPFIPLETAKAIYADPRTVISWGLPTQHWRHCPGGYRVTGEWHFANGSRQANWMGAHCQIVEPDGSLRLTASAGQPPAPCFSQETHRADPRPEHDRDARHGVGGGPGQRPVRAGSGSTLGRSERSIELLGAVSTTDLAAWPDDGTCSEAARIDSRAARQSLEHRIAALDLQ